MVVEQLQSTRVEEPTLLCNHDDPLLRLGPLACGAVDPRLLLSNCCYAKTSRRFEPSKVALEFATQEEVLFIRRYIAYDRLVRTPRPARDRR